MYLSPLASPQVDVFPRNQTVPEGKTTNISCKASGVPNLTVTWSFENKGLPSEATVKITEKESLLQLPDTVKHMEGAYKCTARNRVGEAEAISTLHVIGVLFILSCKSLQTSLFAQN